MVQDVEQLKGNAESLVLRAAWCHRATKGQVERSVGRQRSTQIRVRIFELHGKAAAVVRLQRREPQLLRATEAMRIAGRGCDGFAVILQ